MQNIDTPELGDTVEWGKPLYSYPPNMPKKLLWDADRGEVVKLHKNGDITVVAEREGKRWCLKPGQYIVLSKAG